MHHLNKSSITLKIDNVISEPEPDGIAPRATGNKVLKGEAIPITDGKAVKAPIIGHSKEVETTVADNSKFGYYMAETKAILKRSITDGPTAGQVGRILDSLYPGEKYEKSTKHTAAPGPNS